MSGATAVPEPVWGPLGERWLREGSKLLSDLRGDDTALGAFLTPEEIAALPVREEAPARTSNIIPLQRRELPKVEPFRVHFASEFAESRPVEWLVADIIPRGTVSLLAGAEFLGKTFLCQMLMMALALGKTWFGRPLDRSRSYAIFSEDPHERVLIPRRNRILDHYGGDFRDIDEAASWTSPSDKYPIFDPTLYRCERFKESGKPTELWRMALQHCAELGVSLMILDNASTVLRGQEQDQVMAFCRMLMAAAMQTGMAILVLHHPPKDRTAIYAGVANWVRALRHVLVLQRPKGADEDQDDGRRVLRVHASNWTAERPRIYMRWEGGVLVADEAPVEPGRRWPLSRTEKHELVLACCKAVRTVIERGGQVVADMEHAHSLPSRSRRWASWQGYTREQVDDAVHEAVKSGYLVRDGREVRPPS